jgi:alpha-N-arabinofuranosidase
MNLAVWGHRIRIALACAALLPFLANGGFLLATTESRVQTPRKPEATIEIDTSKEANYKIPRTIFGSFLEPIGNSIYGGLWADVLQNPSFEEGLWNAENLKKILAQEPMLARSSELGLPLPWEPLDYEQQNRYAPRWNDAANSYRSLLVMGLPDKEVGVRQKVYLPVHRTLCYIGHLYAKLLSGSGKFLVSIRQRNRANVIFTESSITLHGKDWAPYQFHLELPAAKLAPLEASDFVVSVEGETRVLLDQASLFPDDSVDGMDTDVVSMAKAMKSPIVRFGGNFTSAYHWRDGVGPQEKRVSMMNVAWGIPEYNTFGTDEFLHFCELIGARPQIALNLGTGTPDEAAAWVSYVNGHWGDKSHSLSWELGNELWAKFQVGYPTLQRVAGLTKAFGEAVRSVDPNAVLIGTGGDEDFYRDWNAAQLKNPSALNYLSTHFVVTTTEVQKKTPSLDFLALASFALPVGLETKLHEMYEQIQSSREARNNVKIAFTEWLFWAQADNAVRYDNMGGAVDAAGFLNMLMRTADIVPLADMTGIISFGGIQKERSKVFGAPAYWAFRMYSNADATTPVETHVHVEKYNLEGGSARLPNIPEVPYLDVVAALNDSGDTLTLFCVNRHLSRDISTAISISGFTASLGTSAQTLYAPSLYMKNDETNPEAIRPVETSVNVEAGKIEVTFRPASVTVIALRKSR